MYTIMPAYTVSEDLLRREDFRAACRERDFAKVFRLMRRWDGASQDRISAQVEGLTQSRISRVVRGTDRVSGLDVIERIADGLRIPGGYFGLAPRSWESDADTFLSLDLPTPIGDQQPVDPRESTSTGEVIDRHLRLDIDIDADGWARLTYRHALHNATTVPFTRLSRELWFEHTRGTLDIQPLTDTDRNVIIQRIHNTPSMATFACQLFPALLPGETAEIGCTCTGARFVSDHYWSQFISRPTDEFTIRLRHQGITSLSQCAASEERPDGSEVSASENLTWSRDGNGIVIELTRRNLRPNQSVTLRWDRTHAAG